MRLGACPCVLKIGSSAHTAYGKDEVSERHRHRFEFNFTASKWKNWLARFRGKSRKGFG